MPASPTGIAVKKITFRFVIRRKLPENKAMKKSYLPSRRRMLQTSLAGAGFLFFSTLGRAMRPASTLPPKLSFGIANLKYPFKLDDLPYAHDAFEPGIDAKTMEIHHSRHHNAYVNNLNAALEKEPSWQSYSLGDLLAKLDTLPSSIRTTVRNNGGGHANHALYWETMRPGGSSPTGELANAIERKFGDLGGLRAELKSAAGSRFGSGWSWLVCDTDGILAVRSTANQDSPYMDGQLPLFGIDVWEHAYYLKYQNRRGDYVDAYLDVADWATVSKNYDSVFAS